MTGEGEGEHKKGGETGPQEEKKKINTKLRRIVTL